MPIVVPMSSQLLYLCFKLKTRSQSTLHALSTMNGLTQSYIFKEKLLEYEPLDLDRFVVDLRDGHLEYWAPYPDTHA